MGEKTRGFGGQLYERLKSTGLSRNKIYKALALQRLGEEVSRLGREKDLPESVLIEISKIANLTAQKQLVEVVIEHKLSLSWTREVSRLIRVGEALDTDEERSKVWDFFFNIRDRLADKGNKRTLLKKVKEFRTKVEKGEDEEAEAAVVETEEDAARKILDLRTLNVKVGKGLDVGTANIVAAVSPAEGGNSIFNIQRNAFLDMRDDRYTKRYLAKLNIDYTAHQGRLYVIGDPAFELANVFEKDARRPMKDGMISPYEPEALVIVDQLIHSLMGPPQQDGEICAFSVPAPPIDMERDNIYHQGVLESLLSRNGYKPKAVLEGMAVVYSELEKTGFTGIGISCGGGMFNVCIAFKSIPAAGFSTSRGGDWVDYSVAKAVGLAGSQVAAIKESGVHLTNPQGRVEEAITIYYRNLIRYTIEQIRREIESSQTMPDFDQPVPIVFAGGTSLVGDFIDIARQEIEKFQFPFEIAEVRIAKDPLHTVSTGCLAAALQEHYAAEVSGKDFQAPQSPFAVRELPKRSSASRDKLAKLGALQKDEEAKAVAEPAATTRPAPAAPPAPESTKGAEAMEVPEQTEDTEPEERTEAPAEVTDNTEPEVTEPEPKVSEPVEPDPDPEVGEPEVTEEPESTEGPEDSEPVAEAVQEPEAAEVKEPVAEAEVEESAEMEEAEQAEDGEKEPEVAAEPEKEAEVEAPKLEPPKQDTMAELEVPEEEPLEENTAETEGAEEPAEEAPKAQVKPADDEAIDDIIQKMTGPDAEVEEAELAEVDEEPEASGNGAPSEDEKARSSESKQPAEESDFPFISE